MGEDSGNGHTGFGKDESDLSYGRDWDNAKVNPLEYFDHSDIISVIRENSGFLGNKNIKYTLTAWSYAKLSNSNAQGDTNVEVYVQTVGLLNPEKTKISNYRKPLKNLSSDVQKALMKEYDELLAEKWQGKNLSTWRL